MNNRLDTILEKLKDKGFRITPQRVSVIREMIFQDKHPTAEEVYLKVLEQFPMTSLATVYKTINLLKEIGEINELALGDSKTRFDIKDPTPHPHFHCEICGNIYDLEIDGIEDKLEQADHQTGFQIKSYVLELTGVCPDCKKKSRDKGE